MTSIGSLQVNEAACETARPQDISQAGVVQSGAFTGLHSFWFNELS